MEQKKLPPRRKVYFQQDFGIPVVPQQGPNESDLRLENPFLNALGTQVVPQRGLDESDLRERETKSEHERNGNIIKLWEERMDDAKRREQQLKSENERYRATITLLENELKPLRKYTLCPIAIVHTTIQQTSDTGTSANASKTADVEALLKTPLVEMDYAQHLELRKAIISHCQAAHTILLPITLMDRKNLMSEKEAIVSLEREVAMEQSKLESISEEEASKAAKLLTFDLNDNSDQQHVKKWQHERALRQHQDLVEEVQMQQMLYESKKKALDETRATRLKHVQQTQELKSETDTLISFGEQKSPVVENTVSGALTSSLTAASNETVAKTTETSVAEALASQNIETVHKRGVPKSEALRKELDSLRKVAEQDQKRMDCLRKNVMSLNGRYGFGYASEFRCGICSVAEFGARSLLIHLETDSH